MRGKISKVTSILAIAVILLTMSKALAAEPSEPHPGDSIWIEPSTINLSTGTYPVGYKFNVTVWINMTVTTVTWQFKLAYNKNHLNATRCGYTAGTKSNFYKDIGTMPLEPSFGVFNATCDYALHGEVAFGSERIAGYGTLAWVEFEVKAKPPEGQTWTSKLSMVEVYPEGTETYAQAPDQSKIPLNTYEATYIIPEFSSSLSLLIVVFLTVIALLSRKLQCHLRRH